MKMRISTATFLFILSGSTALAEPSALVQLVTVHQGWLTPEIVAYGTVASDPNHQMAVVSGHDARVAQVFARLGQTVKKADRLAMIQNTPSSVAQYAQAVSALSFADKDLQQTRRLYGEQLATRSQLAASQKAYSDAQAIVTQQRLMGSDLVTETLVAPSDGIIVTLNAARGDTVAAGATVATIASKGTLVVNLGLEPANAPDVHVGAEVLLDVPNSSATIKSRIISTGSMLDGQSRLVNAVARLPNASSGRLLVGSTLRARVALDGHKGIVVPRGALLSDNDGAFVLTVEGDIAHRHAVTVAFQAGSRALITSGLQSGQHVVIGGAAGVVDGMHVRTR